MFLVALGTYLFYIVSDYFILDILYPALFLFVPTYLNVLKVYNYFQNIFSYPILSIYLSKSYAIIQYLNTSYVNGAVKANSYIIMITICYNNC